jgi:hypothetical protein
MRFAGGLSWRRAGEEECGSRSRGLPSQFTLDWQNVRQSIEFCSIKSVIRYQGSPYYRLLKTNKI